MQECQIKGIRKTMKQYIKTYYLSLTIMVVVVVLSHIFTFSYQAKINSQLSQSKAEKEELTATIKQNSRQISQLYSLQSVSEYQLDDEYVPIVVNSMLSSNIQATAMIE